MSTQWYRPGALGVLPALGLTFLLAGQALGVTWLGPVAITGWSASPGGMVTLGDSTAVVTYSRVDGVFVKRSADSGATWGARIRLSSIGGESQIGGRGSNVDVVWAEQEVDEDYELQAASLFYARSSNRGASFSARIVVADFPEATRDPNLWAVRGLAVARGPNRLVAVTWEEHKSWYDPQNDTDHDETTTRIRVSTDGGASFGPPTVIATAVGDGGSALAVADEVIYVAYVSDWSVLQVTRSVDAGSTWSSPRTITSDFGFLTGFEQGALTADGSEAYLAYETNGSLRYKRTTDKGSSWSTTIFLSATSGMNSWLPKLYLKGGILRAVYLKTPNTWADGQEELFYRQSSDGTAWTPARKVTQGGWPEAVGYAGKILVLHEEVRGDYYEPRAVVYRGTP